MRTKLKKEKVDFEYLVVGCFRRRSLSPFSFRSTRRMLNFFLEPDCKEYHDLHSTAEFYHIDYNEHENPDELVDFFDFEPAYKHQFKLILTEYCSLFKEDLNGFIEKCNNLLCDGGILLIRGVVPDQLERSMFERIDFYCCYENVQIKNNDLGVGWSIYCKGKDYSFSSMPFSLSESVQQLIAKSGYEIPPVRNKSL